ncbi:MAG: hypothetical protein WAZ77_12660 [Candidatus Nitrosopolaris sp.]
MTAQSTSHTIISTLQSIVIVGVISGIGLIRHDGFRARRKGRQESDELDQIYKQNA